MKRTYFHIFFALIFIFFSCNYNKKKRNEKQHSYFCNAEIINESNQTLCDKNDKSLTFNGYKLRTNEEAYSGKYSLILTEKNQFAFTFKFPVPEKDQHYKVSVRLKGPSEKVMIVATDSNGFWTSSKTISNKDENGWQLLTLDFYIPPYFMSCDKLKTYVWNSGKDIVYADDFKIEFISNEITHVYEEEALRILIEDDELAKLEEIRKTAFRNKILETTDDSWVNAVILYKDKDFKAKLRLKGDWLDHLNGIKWSFRIKLKKGGTFKCMREFSIQTPAARHFLDEWIAHKIFLKEDVLTTKYDFIPVYLNNKNLGLYAYEEHFTKQLIESNNRREGPIIKFSEDQLWKSRIYKENDNLPHFYASEILPFKENKTLSDNNLRKQFENAQNLLYQYKFFTKKTSQIFDINKLAKYLALVDLTKSYHGLIWHNQRFYYNPVLSKLEPIAFDNYCEVGVMQWTQRSIYGNINRNQLDTELNGFSNTVYLFTDINFIKLYIHYLKKYTDNAYLTNFFKNNKDEIIRYSKNLQIEFPDYQYDSSFLYTNSNLIKEKLKQYIKNINNNQNTQLSALKLSKEYKTVYNKEIAPYFVKAWSDHNKIKIINYYPFEINILGIGTHKKIITEPFTENINLGFLQSTEFSTELADDLFLYFKIKDQNDILTINVNKRKFPTDYNPAQQLSEETDFKSNKNYIISGNKVIFKNGKKTITNPIIIPKGYKVIFEAGANLDIINHSMFLSYSPVFLLGKKNNKIIIQSSDGTAMGFTVLQANEKSLIQHTVFNNLNTLDFKGWTLTGAVNFYESDVIFTYSTFKNNYCEDALNIIRSNFNVENCGFENIFSDAFDSDFCKGKISETNFNIIGNDAIDFSGSFVEISDCDIRNAGDKGISGGENSTLNVSNCIISDSKTGVASKDKSTVNLNDCFVKNCHYGLVAFQKKPEFGPAIIKANNLKYTNLINFHLIEKKSLLQLNKKKISGYDKNTAKRFY